MCEDLHTSYWPEYDGGYKKKNTFIEYSKDFIDYINAWHSRTRQLAVDENTKAVYGLHYYESILVIEKQILSNPTIQLNI